MKQLLTIPVPRSLSLLFGICIACFTFSPCARAGLTLEMNLVHYNYQSNYYYYFSPYLNTNSSSPAVPFGTYYVVSPGFPTNGATALYQYDNNGFNQINSGSGGFADFDAPDFNSSFIKSLTNGQWTIFVTNTVTTNAYHFNVTANITSNSLPPVVVTFPLFGALNVTNRPTFTWQGPTNFSDLVVYEGNGTYLPVTQTSWLCPQVLNQGINDFTAHYDSNSLTVIVSSVPRDSSLNPISSWVSTSHLQTLFDSQFTVGTPDESGTAHALVAHYPFDATDGGVLNAATDASGNGLNLTFEGSFGSNGGDNLTSDAAAGPGAVQFHNGDAASGGHLGWNNPTPPPLLSTLAGSFSISCWIKTTQNFAWDSAPADQGAGIVAADNFGQANDLIPIALTGSKIAFGTGGSSEDATLTSSTGINDGQYHHIVVTRNQATGQKIIYIDGIMDSFSAGSTNLLSDAQKLTLGSLADASNPEPNDDSYYNGFDGEIDDLQIYSGVLSAGDVASLYANPGATTADADFNSALGTSNLTWSTSGDARWFVETTNTTSGLPAAAQSGSVVDYQTSSLSTTVTGPGTVTFSWSSIANDPNQGFYYEFDIDGNSQDSITGDTDWYQDGPFNIGSGAHTLSWTVYSNGDTDPAQAGFLAQVSILLDTNVSAAPVITLNPFSQTNHPGYSAALLAGASGYPTPTWQWFKTGSDSPLPNATNALYIPANSGTAAVAGNYYAVASNPFGAATTATAAVSFVTAPLPPDWARARKSPTSNNNSLTEEYYLASCLDSAGNLYTVGSFAGTNTIGSQTFIASGSTYLTEIIKQSPAGNLVWAVTMTNRGTGTSQANCVVPAPGDGIYVAGNFSGTNWIGTNELVDLSTGPNATAIFLARFDSTGRNLWVRTISGTNFCFTEYYCLVADSAGTVTLSPLIWGSTAFSSSTPATSTNLFGTGQQGALVQYDANGTLRWARLTPDWIDNLTYSAGRIYGSMGNSLTNFSFGSINFVTDRAKTLLALNASDGQPIWMKGLGAPFGQNNPLGLVDDIPVVAVSGTNVFAIGTSFGSNAVFGPYTVSWPSEGYQYFARCDTNGTPQLLTSFGSPTALPWSIAANAAGDVYLSGDFDTYAAFGNNLLAAPRQETIGNGYFSAGFLAKFDRNGAPLWARAAQSEFNLVNFRGMTLASDGVWVCGVGKGTVLFGTNTVYSSTTCIGSPLCTLDYHYSGVFAKIDDGAPTALPVTLLNPLYNGATLRFSFLSQSGFTHAVQYRTNLVSGLTWQTYSTVTGNGALTNISIPLSLFSPSRQGFVRVSTQ